MYLVSYSYIMEVYSYIKEKVFGLYIQEVYFYILEYDVRIYINNSLKENKKFRKKLMKNEEVWNFRDYFFFKIVLKLVN